MGQYTIVPYYVIKTLKTNSAAMDGYNTIKHQIGLLSHQKMKEPTKTFHFTYFNALN